MLLLAACSAPVPAPQPPSPTVEAPAPAPPRAEWTPRFEAPPPLAAACDTPSGMAPSTWPGLEMGASFLEGLAAEQVGLLDASGRPRLVDRLRDLPARADCIAVDLEAELAAARRSSSPVAALVRFGARILDTPLAVDLQVPAGDFEVALGALCEAAGGCSAVDAPSEDLQDVLTPVLFALADLLHVQAARWDGDARGEAWWAAYGGHLTSVGPERPNPAWTPDRNQLFDDRRVLYAATERLARVLEATDWTRVDEAFFVETDAGRVEVAGRGADRHEAPALLRIDLGGDDVYLDAAPGAVQVLVDVAGDDLYTYPGAEGVEDPVALPADADGRGDLAGIIAQATLSSVARQGGAHAGVSLHLDLGDGADRYRTLRGGQGYAHLGVGVLFDAGGDDEYWAEEGAQGSASFGIGLLVDLGEGADRYVSLHASQGFAGPGGFGALIDDGGDDAYRCASTPARYPAPQVPDANASFCQGASQGFRSEVPGESLSGGLGLLADLFGADAYSVAVFGQGTGYWLGTGVLLDAAGADHYQHQWYAAGAAAHFGTGVLVDLDGDDTYGDEAAANMTVGAGHHFGLGVVVDLLGDDRYLLPSYAGGAASCGSLGLLVDVAGEDAYDTRFRQALGVATVGDCEERGERATRGLFVDLEGHDTYSSAIPEAGDGRSWGLASTEAPTELGVGLDIETLEP